MQALVISNTHSHTDTDARVQAKTCYTLSYNTRAEAHVVEGITTEVRGLKLSCGTPGLNTVALCHFNLPRTDSEIEKREPRRAVATPSLLPVSPLYALRSG